jgi:hypothetical protein
MPRDYHVGIKGTFMDEGTHKRYFASILSNTDPAVDWGSAKGAAAPLQAGLGMARPRG